MKENNIVIVIKAPEGSTSRWKQEEDGTIVIEVVHESERIVSEYNYRNPFIPQGFIHIKGEWKKGFTIRNKADGSDFVWVPAMWLEKDGTLDGKNFNQSFGRRNFRGEEFSEKEFHEEVDSEMLESVEKYGGFYISAYLASVESDKLVFKKGNMPWVKISQIDAKKAAEHYSDGNSDIVTCLPSGAAYDTIFKWIIQAEDKPFEEVVNDSTDWGNYWSFENPTGKVTSAGSRENWSACNVYDLAGNCDEWSTEWIDRSLVVSRGGHYNYCGNFWPAVRRGYDFSFNECDCTSFRAMLFGK